MSYLDDDKIKNYLTWSNSDLAKDWRNINGPPALDVDLKNIHVDNSTLCVTLLLIAVSIILYFVSAFSISLGFNTVFTDQFNITEIDQSNAYSNTQLYASSFYDAPSNWLINNGYKKIEFDFDKTMEDRYSLKHETYFVFVNTKTNSVVKIDVDYGNGKTIRLNTDFNKVPTITLEQFDKESNLPKGIVKRIEDNGSNIRYIRFPRDDNRKTFTIYTSQDSGGGGSGKYYTLKEALN